MIPLALSSAVSVKVGHSYGLKDLPQLKRYALATLVLVFFFMVVTCIAYFTIPAWLLSYATNEADVIAFGVGLMFLCGSLSNP